MTAVARQDFVEDARATRLLNDHVVGATTLTVTAGGLATWGTPTNGRFSVVVDRGTATEEHLYGAAIAGDQITGITKVVGGTAGTAYAHDSSATVEHGVLATHIDEANRFLSSPTAAGQVAVSDAADSWGAPTSTLAGLTLTAPVIADFTSASHDHGDANDGGALVLAALPAAIPRGTMDADEDTTSAFSAAGGATTDMLTLTFTAEAGRRYEFIGTIPGTTNTSAGGRSFLRIRDGAGTTMQTSECAHVTAGIEEEGKTIYWQTTALSGAVTMKLSLASQAGGDSTVVATTASPVQFIAKDIGV